MAVQQAHDGVAYRGERVGRPAGAYLRGVLTQRDSARPMLDGPVRPDDP